MAAMSEVGRKQIILDEIQRIAAETGKAPGVKAFKNATGIAPHEWQGVYWARWGDAVAEAGLEASLWQRRFESSEVLKRVAEAAARQKSMPTKAEMQLLRRADPSFPSYKTITSHFSGHVGLIEALREFCQADAAFRDLLGALPVPPVVVSPCLTRPDGCVYLLKSGAHYKVGRSAEIERRVKEIRVALPEATQLVHLIHTDDPAGIEAYWHRRFADRRANGEWFKLSRDDVAAFRKRKYQ